MTPFPRVGTEHTREDWLKFMRIYSVRGQLAEELCGWIIDHHPPRSIYLQHVLHNNLVESVKRCNSGRSLTLLVCFLLTNAPPNCFGTTEHIAHWCHPDHRAEIILSEVQDLYDLLPKK